MNINLNFASALTCGAGALARSIKGMVKSVRSGERFNFGMMAITVVQGFVIGIVFGAFTPMDPVMAALAGYNGTNMLDGLGFQIEQLKKK